MNKNRTTQRLLAPFLFLAVSCGCGKARSNSDVMRDAIRQHLLELKTLNLSAMDFDVDNTSVQGNQAHVQVTFRPKTGAPPGAGMQVAYLLEKHGASWSVVKTESVGGMISHPAQGTNPHTQTDSPGALGAMPNFRELTSPAAADPNTPLPPGHPPINPDPSAKTRNP